MSHLNGGGIGVKQNDNYDAVLPRFHAHAHASPPSHDGLSPAAAMADHSHQHAHPQHPHQPHQPQAQHSCPYQEKVVANPTTARVLLMFLHDYIEMRNVYSQWSSRCPCPLASCDQVFEEPLQLIDHLLSCPELPKGEFRCWKCTTVHTFATPPDWLPWKGPTAGDVQTPGLQRKRSLSDKVTKVFAGHRRRRSSVDRTAQQQHTQGQCPKHKAGAGTHGGAPFDWNQFAEAQNQMPRQLGLDTAAGQGQVDPRLHPECTIDCLFGNLRNTLQGQVDNPLWECSTPTTESSKMDGGIPWAELDEEMNDMSSTASLYDSTNVTNSSGTSRSSLPYASGLVHPQFHHPRMVGHEGVGMMPPAHQQYLQVMSRQPTVDGSSAPSPFQAQSPQSPLPGSDGIYSGMLSPVDLEQRGDCEAPPQWWGSRPGDLMGLTSVPSQVGAGGPGFVATTIPCASPAELAAASPVHMAMPGVVARAVSGELSISTASGYEMEPEQNPQFDPAYACRTHGHAHGQGMFDVTGPDGAHAPLPVFSPAAAAAPADHPMGGDDDGVDELVCDECNWKPRGVRENLKGYLRKHKNTHKNLRFPCDVAGCNKDFGRQDNLKAHKRDKHHIDDTSASSISAVTTAPTPAALPVASAPAPVPAGGVRAEEPSEEKPSRLLLPEHTVLWGLNY